MASLTGQTLKGYELRERVGSGGYGAVYRAWQPAIARDVAIKVILPQFANQPAFVRRFEVEVPVELTDSAGSFPTTSYHHNPMIPRRMANSPV